MARPRKKTLDFFLHDAKARSDRKIKGLRRRHGNDGYATYFILLEMLCEEEGMRLSLSTDLDKETVIEETGTRDLAHLHAIVQTCADIGLFDKQLWESERIVFSHGLYERYRARLEARKSDAARKRRKREAEYFEQKLQETDQEQKTDPDPDTYTDPKHPELSDSFPVGKPQEEGRKLPQDPFFAHLKIYPWVTSRRGRVSQYDDRMKRVVERHLNKTQFRDSEYQAEATDVNSFLSRAGFDPKREQQCWEFWEVATSTPEVEKRNEIDVAALAMSQIAEEGW